MQFNAGDHWSNAALGTVGRGASTLIGAPSGEASAPPRRRIAISGVRIDDLSMDQTVEMIDHFIEDGGFHQIATANVDFLTKALADSDLLTTLHGCDLVLADGMPLVWCSRLMGVPLQQRVTGADLLPRLLELSARKHRRIFLLGASEERSRVAMERIESDFPSAVICGRHSPPFAPLDQMNDEPILAAIEAAKPDILLVAFGNPKQEKWICKHRERLTVPVCIGVGASIDFLSGKQSRAPLWMQRSGLEWLFRWANEPRRLTVRYADNALFLIRHLSVQLLTTALQPRPSGESVVSCLWSGDALTVTVSGRFSGSAVEQVMEAVRNCGPQAALILDLSLSTSIAPDASGAIAHLSHERALMGHKLWIVGETPGLRKALRATFPAGQPFQSALSLQDALRLMSTHDVI